VAQGLVAEISGTTLWRWLNADALRPWQHRSWIFPRDPDFAAKAGRILDPVSYTHLDVYKRQEWTLDIKAVHWPAIVEQSQQGDFCRAQIYQGSLQIGFILQPL